jgi:hypothetical protein
MHFLHLVHEKDTQVCWIMNMFFVQVPQNHQYISLYLMLNDERCLNALLSVGLLPLTSTHLLWKQGLESHDYLEACSHQWQFLSPLIVGNTLMSHDRWILQVLDLNTFIHTCKNVLGVLIPTFIIGRLSCIC